MGERARHMLDTSFTRRQGLLRWRELLDRLAPSRQIPGGQVFDGLGISS